MSAVCLALGVWFAYEAIVDFRQADFAKFAAGIGVAAVVLSFAFTPSIVLEHFSSATQGEQAMPKASLILTAVSGVAFLVGAVLLVARMIG